jgi:hypothetical protein
MPTTAWRLCAVIVTIAFFPSAFAHAAATKPTFDDDAAVEEALVSLEKQSWVAWKNRDGKFFEGFLSDDHIEIHPNGPAGKRVVVDSVTSTACRVESYALGAMTFTRIAADVAVLVYRAEQNTLCGDRAVPSPVWTTSLFARRGGQWLNVLYQHTAAIK